MKLPQEITDNLKKEVFGILLPGDTIVCAGPVGLRETMRVLETEKRQLAAFFSVRFLDNIKSLQDASVFSRTPEELKERFVEIDFSSLHSFIPVGEEGFLTALWKMAEVSGVGLRIDLRSVPLLQQTVEIAEILDMDPYKQDSRGACLLGTDHAEILLSEFTRAGIPAAVIGYALKSNDRLMYSQNMVRYLDRPPGIHRKEDT